MVPITIIFAITKTLFGECYTDDSELTQGYRSTVAFSWNWLRYSWLFWSQPARQMGLKFLRQA